MADYTSVASVKSYLGESWGPDRATIAGGGPNSRDGWLANQVTVVSRLFDRETGRPANWWQSAPGTTREYSGSGTAWLDIDEWDQIDTITMSSNSEGTDMVTLSTVAGDPDFVAYDPLNGPPYNRLYLLRGWLPDPYDIGNIRITGTPTLPAEISDAVAIWVAYRYKRRDAGFADPGRSRHTGNDGPSYAGDVPMEVLSIIEYYRSHNRGAGPHLAMLTGMPYAYGGLGMRAPLWLDWTTH